MFYMMAPDQLHVPCLGTGCSWNTVAMPLKMVETRVPEPEEGRCMSIAAAAHACRCSACPGNAAALPLMLLNTRHGCLSTACILQSHQPHDRPP